MGPNVKSPIMVGAIADIRRFLSCAMYIPDPICSANKRLGLGITERREGNNG